MMVWGGSIPSRYCRPVQILVCMQGVGILCGLWCAILYDGGGLVPCVFPLPPSLLLERYGAIRSCSSWSAAMLHVVCCCRCLLFPFPRAPRACIDAGLAPFLVASTSFSAASSASTFIALTASDVALVALARCAAIASS